MGPRAGGDHLCRPAGGLAPPPPGSPGAGPQGSVPCNGGCRAWDHEARGGAPASLAGWAWASEVSGPRMRLCAGQGWSPVTGLPADRRGPGSKCLFPIVATCEWPGRGAPLPFGVVPFLICGGPACTWRRGWGARCAWDSAAASPSSLCGCAGLSLERPSCCTPCAPQAVSPATICPKTSKTKLGMSLALGPQLWLLNCWWGSRQPGGCLLAKAALRAAYPGHSGRFRDAGQSSLGRRG